MERTNNTYVQKPVGKYGYEICRVIDSDISTGAALVYNLATEIIEVLPWGCRSYVGRQANEWQNAHAAELEKGFNRACKKYADFILAFRTCRR